MTPRPIENVRVHAGRGVSGDNGPQTIRLGSPAFLAESGVEVVPVSSSLEHAV